MKKTFGEEFYDAILCFTIGFCFGIGAAKLAQYFGV